MTEKMSQAESFENQLGDLKSLASYSRETVGSACVCYKIQAKVFA